MSVEVYSMGALAIGAGFDAILGDVGCGKLVETNIMKGEHKTPEMLAINPFGGIPFLKDGDFCLAEELETACPGVYHTGLRPRGAAWGPHEPRI